MWGWRSSRTVVIGLAAALFGVSCVLPLASFLMTSLRGATTAFALDARQWGLLVNTAGLGVGTAVVASAIGAPLGLLLARASLPCKTLLRVGLAAPLLLPPYVVALAWTYLGSNRGLLATVAGYDALAAWTYSLPAAVLVLGLVLYPLSMLATEVALNRIDGRLEEAALMVVGPRGVFWRITVGLVAPSIMAAALVIFVLAVSEFGVPGVLRVRVYTTEIFTAFAALYDPGRAARLALPLLALCLAVAVAAVALLGDRFVSARRGAGTPSALRFERSHALLAGIAVVLVTTLGLPIAVLAREALNSRSILAVVGGSGDAIANSVRLATLGASAVVGIAIWLGYARARASGRVAHLADIGLVVLFAVPGTLVGVGLIDAWNRPGPLGALYGTDSMLVLAYLARLLPVAVLALAASSRTVPMSHEEAAAVSGAGWLRTMWRIVIPQMRVGLVVAWLIVFVLAFGELGVSILVAPPGETTLPIRIYTIIANAPSSSVAVLALLQASIILGPLAVLGAILVHREVS
jgi:iron(III) transport system permease protein